ncbi:hypothetical protein H4S14_003520 [Agrobacterium vitis]|nr:hypothetical protein [Agrobacterium vitis]MBE1439755.1 hypothetical protein [Agrobacterium vitis]
MTIQETYITNDAYHGILDKLENLFRTFDTTAPDDLRTRMVMILGEEGGVWPASCQNGDDKQGVNQAA